MRCWQGHELGEPIDRLVLDEGDQMIDLGFYPAIKRIFETLPSTCQTVFFSATMPTERLMSILIRECGRCVAKAGIHHKRPLRGDTTRIGPRTWSARF